VGHTRKTELVIDNETGVVTESGDYRGLAKGISHLLNNQEEARRLTQNARLLIETSFNIQLHASRIMNTYDNLLTTTLCAPRNFASFDLFRPYTLSR